jgi:hypothetical protein
MKLLKLTRLIWMNDGSIEEEQCFVNTAYIHYVTLGNKLNFHGKATSQHTEITWIRGSMPWFVKESIADILMNL